MNLKKLSLTAITLFAFSCASTHLGKAAKPLTDTKFPITVSARTIDDSPEDAFQLIEVTVENNSDDWFRVNQSEVIIENPAESKVSVVVGKDLNTWAQAMQARLKKDEHNKKLLQTGLLTAGAIMSATSSKNTAASQIGTVAVIGTTAWVVADVINQSYQQATQSKKVPENHLYESFSVPGKMFLRRWVLLNKPSNKKLTKLVVKFETAENEKGTYEIPL